MKRVVILLMALFVCMGAYDRALAATEERLEREESIVRDIPFYEEIRYNSTLEIGTYHVVQEGKVGQQVDTYVVAYDVGTGELLEREKVKTETTDPVLKIVEVGTKEKKEVKTVEIPFDPEPILEHDTTMPIGTTRKLPGENGLKEVTTITTWQDGEIVQVIEEVILKEPLPPILFEGAEQVQSHVEHSETSKEKPVRPQDVDEERVEDVTQEETTQSVTPSSTDSFSEKEERKEREQSVSKVQEQLPQTGMTFPSALFIGFLLIGCGFFVMKTSRVTK